MRSLLLALAVFAAPLTAQALWVDAVTGSDTNPGTAASPLLSITAALNQVAPGMTIFVRAGTYSLANTNEQFPMQFGNGLTHDNVTLYGFDGAVLDFGNSQGNGLQVGLQANGSRITGLTFTNMDKSAWWARAISAGTYNGSGSSTNVELDRCTFIDLNRGIVLWQGMAITGWKIHDNLFIDMGNDCINEFDPGSANTIHDNTFAGSAHLGVLTDADGTLVVNNVFTNLRVGVASGATPAAAATRVHSNSFWLNTLDVEGSAFPAGLPAPNFTVDPVFVNPSADDFRLQATSPLIDAGDPLIAQRADLDRVPGAVDSDMNGTVFTDVGAYETTPVSVTASATNAVSLNFQVTSTASNLPIAFVLFGTDEGLIQLGGLSPILIDPAALVVPGFSAGMPWVQSFGIPAFPIGARIIIQGFGYDPAANLLISGAAVRVQF